MCVNDAYYFFAAPDFSLNFSASLHIDSVKEKNVVLYLHLFYFTGFKMLILYLRCVEAGSVFLPAPKRAQYLISLHLSPANRLINDIQTFKFTLCIHYTSSTWPIRFIRFAVAAFCCSL